MNQITSTYLSANGRATTCPSPDVVVRPQQGSSSYSITNRHVNKILNITTALQSMSYKEPICSTESVLVTIRIPKLAPCCAEA